MWDVESSGGPSLDWEVGFGRRVCLNVPCVFEWVELESCWEGGMLEGEAPTSDQRDNET